MGSRDPGTQGFRGSMIHVSSGPGVQGFNSHVSKSPKVQGSKAPWIQVSKGPGTQVSMGSMVLGFNGPGVQGGVQSSIVHCVKGSNGPCFMDPGVQKSKG